MSQYNSQINQNNIRLNSLITNINNLPLYVNTTDATALASDILTNKTAYVNGVKVTRNFLL